MSTGKRLVLIFVAVVAAAVAVFVLREENEPLPGPLVLYGNIDVRQVNLAFNVGAPIASMLVEEGDSVVAGQLLAELEGDSYQYAVDVATARLESAMALMAKLVAGSRPAEITRAKARVEEARALVRNAEITFERRKQLVERGDASRQAFDDAALALDAARARLKSVEQDLALVVEGPRHEDIDAAGADLKAARAVLAAERYRLSRTRLIAPSNGIVLTRILEPGAVVQAQSPVYTISLIDPVWARTYVAEPDLGRIYPGMRGDVFTDSYPDRVYHGWIGFISPTAEFTPKTVETPDLRTDLVYRLRLYIENPDQGLRQGMPVTVRLNPEGSPPEHSRTDKKLE